MQFLILFCSPFLSFTLSSNLDSLLSSSWNNLHKLLDVILIYSFWCTCVASLLIAIKSVISCCFLQVLVVCLQFSFALVQCSSFSGISLSFTSFDFCVCRSKRFWRWNGATRVFHGISNYKHSFSVIVSRHLNMTWSGCISNSFYPLVYTILKKI